MNSLFVMLFVSLPMLSEAKDDTSEVKICLPSDNQIVLDDLKNEFREMDFELKDVPCTFPPIIGLCGGELLNDVYENEIEELNYSVVYTNCQTCEEPS